MISVIAHLRTQAYIQVTPFIDAHVSSVNAKGDYTDGCQMGAMGATFTIDALWQWVTWCLTVCEGSAF